jgi:transcription initiation factor TFIIB
LRLDRYAFASGWPICPACNSYLVGDPEKGEQVCPRCGVVVEEKIPDPQPEWKAIDLEEKQRRVRVGAPLTLTLHDMGLTTDIGPAVDGAGLQSPEAMADLQRLSKWQKRIRTTSAEERSLSNLLNRVNELVEVLGLPQHVAETSSHIIRTAVKTRVSKSRSVTGLAGAAVYLACRKCDVSRTLQDVAAACQMDRYALAHYYRYIVKMLEGHAVPLPPIEKYIAKLVGKLKMGSRVERVAVELARKVGGSPLMDGKSPAGIAAAYVYIASALVSRIVPQREIAQAAQITEVTLRNRYKELVEHYKIQQKLKPLQAGGSAAPPL